MVIHTLSSYQFEGLSALPEPPGSDGLLVYRGLPASCKTDVAKRYTVGTTVFWSSFTSTSCELSVALQPTFSESGGVLFKITTFTGRVIKAVSAIPTEDEVLLGPNTQFLVTKNIYHDLVTDRFVVEMMERKHEGAMIR